MTSIPIINLWCQNGFIKVKRTNKKPNPIWFLSDRPGLNDVFKIRSKKNRAIRSPIFSKFTKSFVNSLSKYLLYGFFKIFNFLAFLFVFVSNFTEKQYKRLYGAKKDRFTPQYNKTDLAYIAYSISSTKKITLFDIQKKFNLSYHYALEVKKMTKNKLLLLDLIKKDNVSY